jgi:hypothetical protein
MKIDLKEIEIKDLDGFIIPIENFEKNFANFMWLNGETIEVDSVARGLHKGEYDASEEELQAVMDFFKSGLKSYKMFAHLQIVKYFEHKLETIKKP